MSGLADERDAAAGRDVQLDPPQHGLGPVREHDVIDLEVAHDAGQLDGVVAVADPGLLVEDARDLHHRRRPRLQLAIDVGELLERLEHELEQVQRGDQRPDRQRVVREQFLAEEEDAAGGDHAEELDRREEDREDLLHVRRLRAIRLVQLVELRLERTLAVERLHDGHPGDGLGDLRGHGADPVALLDERDVRGVREPARQDERRRQDREDDEPEPPVGDEERGERSRKEHDVRDERRHPLREHVGDRVDVARQPGDDPAGLLLREVAEGEPGQMVEEVAAQADRDLLAETGEAADQPGLQDPAGRRDAEVDRDDDREVVRVSALMPLSIALRTRSQPPVWHAAFPAAMSTIRDARSHRPSR